MNEERAEKPVVVVGAGPVGLTAAIELARREVPVRVIDVAACPATTSKAIGTMPRTLEVLERSGVTDRLVELGVPIRRFRLHDQDRILGELDLTDVPSAYPYALSLGQDVTERVLRDRLSEAGVKVEWSTRLRSLRQDSDRDGHAGQEVRLVLERDGGDPHQDRAPSGSEEVMASWVVGCDGASSTVRRQAGIDFAGEPFPEWFLVADLLIDADLGAHTANLFFSGAGATAVFPLPEPGVFRLATPLPPDDTRDDAPEVDLAAIQRLWASRIGRPAELSDPRWISPFQFQSRLADRYRRGRVFLAGDAAHVHSPVGGQGMNTGIQDAVNLAWKLAAVRRGAPAGLLETYQAERRPVAARVLQSSRREAVMVSSRSSAARTARAVALPLVTRIAPVRRRVLCALTMLSMSYPPTDLPGCPPGPSLSARVTGTPAVGERAPDASIISADGPCRLLEVLARHSHILLRFDARDSNENHQLADLARETLHTRGDLTVILVRRRHSSSGSDSEIAEQTVEIHDPDGQAHRAYAASRPLAVLIRSDGVIAWRGDDTPGGSSRLWTVLDAMLPAKVT